MGEGIMKAGAQDFFYAPHRKRFPVKDSKIARREDLKQILRENSVE
jgi:hypothetical protein